MKLSSTLLALSLGFAFADDDRGQHTPKLLGARKFLSELEARRRASSVHAQAAARAQHMPARHGRQLGRRQDDEEGRCGPGIGSCLAGDCCSAEGWCGTGIDYCTAPDCQINYGPGCDANQKPSGADTSGVARPKLGSVLYGGTGIYDCVKPGDIALTFDDGPYIYTNDLLDKLKSYGAKATFFITGTNLGKGKINDPSTIYPAIIRRMHAEGHQIGSHTWSHQNASQLTNTQFTNQMVWNEIAINSILGFFPTYMRPPYSICEKNCQNILSTLGYHVIYFDLDTEGYLHDNAKQIQTSKDIWDDAIDGSDPASDSFLQIEHDIHYQVVYNLTDYILTSLFSAGYQAVTVGECLGDPVSNWYRTGPSGSGSAVPSATATATTTTSRILTRSTLSVAPTQTGASTDGTCGNGVTCAGTRWGSCCSVFGYCGVGDEYCSLDNGCQLAWGSCDGGGTSAASSRTAVPTRSTAIVTRSTASTTAVSSRTTVSTRSTGIASRSTVTTVSSRTAVSTKSTVVVTRSTAVVTSTSSAKPTQTGLAISDDGLCGPEVQQTCSGSTFGTCCSPAGKCSSNAISCLTILGCQRGYGSCN
ncbi:carbohydrate esterase family 4 protein [Parathielavia appendiculata]|uniref:Carbohydrate esterase family 4 protein n=1 Tax=Parathielavia appendiculata TaxID=2587402 RepID=A0AAN6TZT5_9PEZI|nr:carbohydrate esterase family 4 protein [Parathielavia appendiculata]